MKKNIHEIRDPIHVFIKLDSDERKVLDSKPFQRLRNIHQLALTYLIYPGATHKRFEHSLGVMELAAKVYDILINPRNIKHDQIRDIVNESDFARQYWRRVVRIAALCHDLGHLPFSHAAEKELLPQNSSHEKITVEIINNTSLSDLIRNDIRIDPDDVAKIAVGPNEYRQTKFTEWEEILSEIIIGDAFGVDRIDYLLRDSYHIGVAYGKFDHHRLIDTLRILPKEVDGSSEPHIGVEEGGVQSAEALLLARYFMFSQVYFHSIRRIYDEHLKDFLKKWLPDGMFSEKPQSHLLMTDNEVTVELLNASRDKKHPAFDPADRIVNRKHFKRIYSRNPDDLKKHIDPAEAIYQAACKEYGSENVKIDQFKDKKREIDFPVLRNDGRIVSSLNESKVLNDLPIAGDDLVFVKPEKHAESIKWLKGNIDTILKS